MQNADDVNQESLIEAAGFTPQSIQFPFSWVGHIPFAAWFIKELNPKIFVELGTHTGNSYFSVCQAVKEKGLITKCFAVDTWQGDEQAGKYGEVIFDQVSAHNILYYKNFSTLMRMTFDEASSHFPDKSIELLHIDGLHTYEAVNHDFVTWLPKMAPHGVIFFHDTKMHENDFGVWKLWAELLKKYPRNFEFDHSHGMGVIQLSDDCNIKLINDFFTKKNRFKNYFQSLGSATLKIANRDAQIKDRDAQIKDRDAQIKDRDAQIKDRDAQIKDRDANMGRILNSTIWKVTAPLRALKKNADILYGKFFK